MRQSSTTKSIIRLLLMLLILMPVFSMAIPRVDLIPIKGKITDEAGNPLEGVTVHVKGNNKKTTVTNSVGEFTIDLDRGATLVFTYVGFVAKEITVINDAAILVSLTKSEINLSEVVVTALGIKKEKAKTAYAIQEVKGASLEKATQANVAENLIGKVAGLNILSKTNLFENPEIYLRGNEALVVLDGVPANKESFDFWSINANDIESITVLKGTAAAALYGTLGINGAIMITTKKGKSGANGIEVTVNSSNQFQAGFIKIPETQTQYGMGYGGFYAFINGKGAGGWSDDAGYVWGPKLNVKNSNNASGYEEYPQYNSPYDPNTLYTFTQAGYTDQSHYKPLPWVTKGQNNLHNFLNNELITTNNVTVAGKTDNSDFRISVTHLYQKGQVPNTKLNATTLSLSGGLKINDKMRAEATLSYNKQYTPNYPQTGYGANNFFYNILLWMGPDVDIRDLKSYWKPGGGRNGSGGFIPYGQKNVQQYNYNYTWYNNPWYLANEALNGYTNDVITGQLNFTYDITKELSLFARSGIITNSSLSNQNTPRSYIYYGSGEFDGNYRESGKRNFQIVNDLLLTYKKSFLQKFNATISGGASTRYNDNRYNTSATVGLNIPALYNFNNSVAPVQTFNFLAQRMVSSIFGYADIDYKQMIYLNVTGRNDWSTTLQKPNNSFFYPSTSLSIIPTSIFKLPDFVSFAKLRGSWAKVSTDNINISGNGDIFQDWYGTLPTYQIGPRWNTTNSSLNVSSTLVTNGIRPNTTISHEYGTELRFLKNRVGVDFTYFSYIDKDFVIRAPVSEASGFNNLLVNGDKLNRKGVELILTGTPIKTKNLKWDISANYSTAHSYVKEYYKGDSIRNGIKVGERRDVYRGYTWETSPDGKIVYGSNGFPQYINQLVNMGHTDADFIFGITNNISYKSFSLSFSFDGRIGGIMYNGLEQKLYEGGMHPATANSFRDDSYAGKATYVGDGAIVTNGSIQYDVQGNIISDSRKFAANAQGVNYFDWINATYVNGVDGANIYKRSFVKLREVIVSYNVQSQLLNKTPFKAASISITGRNLILFSKVPFMDPDGYTGTTLAEPTYRNIGVNLNLKF